MATPTTTQNLGVQDYFSSTLSSTIVATDTTIFLNALPTASEGFLVLDLGNAAQELIYYTSKGSNFVTCPDAATGRGQGGTSAAGHNSGVSVKQVVNAQYLQELQNGHALKNGAILTNHLDSNIQGGWFGSSGTWTYVSATTMTVTGTDAINMSIGDRVKLTQTTVKYFYIVGISGTTVTLTGGTDYTLANAAITSPYYSHTISPTGFPQWFNYTPTQTGFSVNQPLTASRFTLTGRVCMVFISKSGSGTSNATSLSFTAPITSASSASSNGYGAAVDNGVFLTAPALSSISGSSSTISVNKDYSGSGWTASGSKGANVFISYEI